MFLYIVSSHGVFNPFLLLTIIEYTRERLKQQPDRRPPTITNLASAARGEIWHCKTSSLYFRARGIQGSRHKPRRNIISPRIFSFDLLIPTVVLKHGGANTFPREQISVSFNVVQLNETNGFHHKSQTWRQEKKTDSELKKY